MKIACIIHSLAGGGAERVMAGLASRLHQRDHQVVLITLDDGQSDRHSLDDSIQRRPLDVMGPSRGWLQKLRNNRQRLRAVAECIAAEKPDVVLSFCDRTNITTLLATKDLDVPVVISERSDPAKHKLGLLWSYARKKAYPLAKGIIALTETSADHLQRYSDQPVVVIASAVDVPPQASDRDHAAEQQCVLGIGRLEYEKGFDRLLQAFEAATVDSPSWKLTILGEGSLRSELSEIAVELGIDDRVSMPGWVCPIWPVFADASIFALPSRYEGFPSALMEAMAAGVPSVAVDCESGPRAIIRHEKNGLLVRNSVEELATGIRRLIDDSELRETIGEAAKTIVDQYGWNKMVDAYEAVLQEAADGAP